MLTRQALVPSGFQKYTGIGATLRRRLECTAGPFIIYAPPVSVVIPANIYGSGNPGQRQRSCFRFDRLALCVGKRLPWQDREYMPCTPPNADGLAFDEQGARPDTRCPQRAAVTLVGHQEFAIGAL